MRNSQVTMLSAANTASRTSAALDVNQVVSASFVISQSDATAAGTFKLQACNDLVTQRDTPTPESQLINWVDIPNASVIQTANTKQIIVIPNMCFSFIRAVWTASATSTGTVTVNANLSAI